MANKDIHMACNQYNINSIYRNIFYKELSYLDMDIWGESPRVITQYK